MRSISHSPSLVEAESFFSEESGTISHTEAVCQTYSAKMSPSDPPAFSNTFKEKIQKMALETDRLWPSNVYTTKIGAEMKSFLNQDNQKKYDDMFSEFIYTFGTHFIESANMGAVMRHGRKIRYNPSFKSSAPAGASPKPFKIFKA